MIGILSALLAGIFLLIAYLLWIRPRQLRWGATDEEVAMDMVGDEVVLNPSFVATRAVTVNTGPEQIWPWIVQIGSKRAGWYSYDRIDNAGVPSAEQIIPDLQQIRIGQMIPFTPDGKYGLWVKEITPNRMTLWWDKKGSATWLWMLRLVDDGQTRLITRLRVRYPWNSPWILYFLLQDVGDIYMMRRCMLGIKRRAESLRARQLSP